MARQLDFAPAGIALRPRLDGTRRCRQPLGPSSFALDIGFGLGIEIPDERLIPGHEGDVRDRRRGDFSSWRGQVGIQVLGIDPAGRMAVDDIIRQPGFCFDDFGERTRLSMEQMRALHTARSSTMLLMLLANDTHPPGLGSLLAPIPRPAEPDFDTGADLRDCVRAWEGYAAYRHFAGSLNRLDELLEALVHPDLIPVWQRSRSLLVLISSGIGINFHCYSAISDALVTHLPESCCRATATAFYASRPETDDPDWVWVDVISG